MEQNPPQGSMAAQCVCEWAWGSGGLTPDAGAGGISYPQGEGKGLRRLAGLTVQPQAYVRATLDPQGKGKINDPAKLPQLTALQRLQGEVQR